MVQPIGSGAEHGGESVREDLKQDASELGDLAKERAEARAGKEQQRAARTVKSASSAMSSAADQLRKDEDAPEWMASALSNAAHQIEDLAGRLQDKSPRDIARETSRFGREHPASFLLASAAAGFAAARFLRAGAEYQHEHEGSGPAQDGWRSSQDYSAAGLTGSQGYGSSTALGADGGTANHSSDSPGSTGGNPAGVLP